MADNHHRPLVSTILPTRNRAQLLGRAIDSILAQKGRGVEFDLDITVIDDASSDGTPDVVRRYPTVQYIRLETRRGPAAARNVGIKSSTGTYIAFQDDDDVWLPEKLRVQTAALEQHPRVGVVYSQSVVPKPEGQYLWPDPLSSPSGMVFVPLLMNCFCAHPPGLLIRRAVFEKVGYFDEALSTNEDYELWLRMAFQFPFRFVPGAVAVYHESPHGLYYSSMARGTAEADSREVLRRALEMLPKGRKYDAIRREAYLRNEHKIILHKVWFAASDERWAAMLGAVRAYPEILRYRWGRGAVAAEGFRHIMRSDTPLLAGRQLSAQLWDVARGHGLTVSLWMRLTLASFWTQAAEAWDERPSRRQVAAAAAAQAILYDPSKVRKRALWSPLFRALLPHE